MKPADERDWYEFTLTPRMRGTCKARCAETGLQCRLPAHGAEQQHSNERGPFRLIALPGQTEFAGVTALERAATGRNAAEVL